MSIGPCVPTAPTPGVVVFDQTAFLAAYPQFSNFTAALQGNFNLATLLLNNTCGSLVCDAPTRQQLLNLLVAHLTTLLNGTNTAAATGLVGRISGATEGSVSVDTDFGLATTSAYVASLSQTQFGVQFLAMTVQYRTARYVPPVPMNYSPWGYYGAGYCGPGAFGAGPWDGCC